MERSNSIEVLEKFLTQAGLTKDESEAFVRVLALDFAKSDDQSAVKLRAVCDNFVKNLDEKRDAQAKKLLSYRMFVTVSGGLALGVAGNLLTDLVKESPKYINKTTLRRISKYVLGSASTIFREITAEFEAIDAEMSTVSAEFGGVAAADSAAMVRFRGPIQSVMNDLGLTYENICVQGGVSRQVYRRMLFNMQKGMPRPIAERLLNDLRKHCDRNNLRHIDRVWLDKA